MFKNKNFDGTYNSCGHNIAALRKALKPKVSQRMLSEKLQLIGIDLDKNAIQRIEKRERFVSDIELKKFAELFNVTTDDLLK